VLTKDIEITEKQLPCLQSMLTLKTLTNQLEFEMDIGDTGYIFSPQVANYYFDTTDSFKCTYMNTIQLQDENYNTLTG